MFIAECDNGEVKKEASKLLKSWNVKHRLKKIELKLDDKKDTDGIFKTRIERQRQKKVKLQQYDHSVTVPAFLVESCNYLRDRIETDGLFRRPGVAMRQRELKQILVSGGRLTPDCEHSAVDVADLLKLFFRELPEPCIPYIFHDLLQRCLEIKERHSEAILVALLLLPLEYLYTLAYLMQFLQDVAAQQCSNRMDISNLAIVWTPNLMPFKTGQVNDKQILNKRLTIVQFLIENSSCIGMVPECVCEHISSWHPSWSVSSHDDLESSKHRSKKKKRRSGSLTRMLSGIKKMVRSSGTEDQCHTTPENSIPVPHTPRIMSTGKKRKASDSNLPTLSAKKSLTRHCVKEEEEPKRRSCFYTSKTPEGEERSKSHKPLSGTRIRLSHFGIGRKHKKKTVMLEDSGLDLTTTPNGIDLSSASEDYVRISRSEYEDIKNRVSRIESRISSEFENIVGVSMSDLELTPDRSLVGDIKTVQSAYEKTLESAEKLSSPSSDELVRRFSRELKIRGSSEKKVIRSPSARKIGSLRRRSKDNVPQIKRNLSLNLPDRFDPYHLFYPTKSLRRGKPNTMYNGLPDPLLLPKDKSEMFLKDFTAQLKSESFDCQIEGLGLNFEPSDVDLTSFGVLTRSQTRRASSFHGCDLTKMPYFTPSNKCANNSTLEETINWKSAETFLNEEKSKEKAVTGRPSVAKLRSQNAGMVLAKAKLFNTMVDSDNNMRTKAFKSSKPCNDRSRDIKKRSSSKSSKERKLLRKDSQNGIRRSKRENSVPKQPTELSDNLSTKVKTYVALRENTGSGKENLHKNATMGQSSIQLPIGKNIEMGLKNSANTACTPVRQSSKKTSPLRERNRNHTPRGSGSRTRVQVPGKSPKVIRQVPNEGRASSFKSVHTTPRRSPRQIYLKSRQQL